MRSRLIYIVQVLYTAGGIISQPNSSARGPDRSADAAAAIGAATVHKYIVSKYLTLPRYTAK